MSDTTSFLVTDILNPIDDIYKPPKLEPSIPPLIAAPYHRSSLQSSNAASVAAAVASSTHHHSALASSPLQSAASLAPVATSMANMAGSMGSMGAAMGSAVANPYANYMPQLSHHTSYSSQYCNSGELSHYDPMSGRHASTGWYGSNPTDPRLASKFILLSHDPLYI